jgi:hypothetical protein
MFRRKCTEIGTAYFVSNLFLLQVVLFPRDRPEFRPRAFCADNILVAYTRFHVLRMCCTIDGVSFHEQH